MRFLKWFNIICYDLEKFNFDIAKYLHGSLLDIGCASKNDLFRYKVDRYTGIEYVSAKEINARFSKIDADIFADALSLPFKKESFDCAVCLSVFEHLKNPQQASNEAFRVLKKGGIFAVTVPFMNRMHMMPLDYFRFTIYGIRHILEYSGFTVIKVVDGGGMWKMIGARLAGYFYSDILGLGYGVDDLETRPKKFLLPIFLPLIFFTVVIFRFLDKLHCVKKDTLHYYLLCRK